MDLDMALEVADPGIRIGEGRGGIEAASVGGGEEIDSS
jgi:hypothetical protein